MRREAHVRFLGGRAPQGAPPPARWLAASQWAPPMYSSDGPPQHGVPWPRCRLAPHLSVLTGRSLHPRHPAAGLGLAVGVVAMYRRHAVLAPIRADRGGLPNANAVRRTVKAYTGRRHPTTIAVQVSSTSPDADNGSPPAFLRAAVSPQAAVAVAGLVSCARCHRNSRL